MLLAKLSMGPTHFGGVYQGWYTRTLPLVKALAPDRFAEFQSYYEVDPKRKAVNIISYTLRDFVNGIPAPIDSWGSKDFDCQEIAQSRMRTQSQILMSLSSRIEGALANVEGHLLAEIEDRELRAATDLSRVNLRAAGALVGVVLERHLSQVLQNRNINLAKKDPSIGEFNEVLKKEGVYEIPTYRKIQYLADIRNVCCHDKKREPTADEVRELLAGVGAIIKTIF